MGPTSYWDTHCDMCRDRVYLETLYRSLFDVATLDVSPSLGVILCVILACLLFITLVDVKTIKLQTKGLLLGFAINQDEI